MLLDLQSFPVLIHQENVIDNTAYSQVLVTPTKEEIEEQIAEYTESCKVVIYSLSVVVYIGIAWQNNES